MATVVDSLVVTLGMDASHFKRESGTINVYLKDARDNAERTAREMDARGVQASQFFSRIKNEALGFIGVLVGARGLKDFVASTTNDLASLGRAAQNMGTSVANLAAFRNMIERNGGSADEAAGAFQRMADQVQRFNTFGEGSAEFIGAKNVVGSGRGDTPMETFLKFSKFAEQHAQEPLRVRMVGQMLGLDQSSINEAMRGYQQVEKDLAESRRLGLPTEQMSQQAQQLQRDWYGLSQAAQNLGNVVYSDTEPALHKVLLWAQDMIVNDPATTKAITAISTGLIALGAVRISANLIGLGGLYTALSSIAVLTSAILIDIAGIADFINRPAGNIAGNDFERAGLDEWRKERGLPPIPAGGVGVPFSSTTGVPSPGTDRAAQMEETRQFFLSKGLTDEQVAGILSNVSSESGFDPQLWGDNNTSYGLFQHHAGRLSRMQAHFGTLTPSAAQQREWAWLELQSDPAYAGVLDKLKAARTPAEAAAIWSKYFEVPRDANEATRRAQNAPRFLTNPWQGGAGLPDNPFPGQPFGAPVFDPSLMPSPRTRMQAPPAASVPKAAGAPGQSSSASPTIGTITVGRIDVHTQATDARGIARDLAGELVSQANRGLT